MEQNIKLHRKTSIWSRYKLAIITCSIALILALGITFATIGTNSNAISVSTTPIKFDVPVANASITKDYRDTELQYNPTLKQWEAHKAIDFTAKAGSPVVAVYEGTVIEAGSSYLNGYYVVIQHKDGLKTTYKSLAKDLKVSKGDVVKKGTVIGAVSDTAANEATQGAHLHFEVTLNDNKVNPNDYFNFNK